MRSKTSEPSNKGWRSRDAADRLIRAMGDPYQRPRWMTGFKSSRQRGGNHPTIIIQTNLPGLIYKVKAFEAEHSARQYRKSHPDTALIAIVIAPGEPMSQIRKKVFDAISTIRQKK